MQYGIIYGTKTLNHSLEQLYETNQRATHIYNSNNRGLILGIWSVITECLTKPLHQKKIQKTEKGLNSGNWACYQLFDEIPESENYHNTAAIVTNL